MLVVAATATALALPATAAAHVTLQPAQAPAGAFVRLDVRVPTERDDAATTKLDLQLPEGFAFASWEPVPGWTVAVHKQRLAEPIKTDDGEVTEGVRRITWTGHGVQGRIPPGAFQDFGLSVMVPGKAGDTLTFKALQTYDDGQVVRWIGAAGSDEPAPTVRVVAAAGEDAASAATRAATAAAVGRDGGGDGDGLAVAVLVVAALALVAVAGGLLAGRRRAAA
jgi:uncharacterized protein